MMTRKILLPTDVEKIIATIEDAGYEAFAVGGCIRDSILGREPNDWDITTSATPEQVKALFRRTIDTGIQHGTVTVMMHHIGYEVTTYRIDGEYEDSRHPKEVTFTADLLEDLKRRDFTINAMAYNYGAGLVDAFGGLQDLEKGIIRCVGDPMERFSEDALRMMRAVRFSAQLGYAIDPATKDAIRVLAPTLQKVSAERIQVELTKLVTSPHPEYLEIAYETGITKQVLPEFDLCMQTEQHNPHHCYGVGEHILRSMEAIPPDKVLRLAMLLHDIGKPQTMVIDEDGISHNQGHSELGETMARDILRRLRYDNDTITKVTRLIGVHDLRMEPTGKAVRRAMNRIGAEYFPMLLQVWEADLAAQSDYCREMKLQRIREIQALYQEIVARDEAVSLKDLAITGKDLIALGEKPGKGLGDILNRLLEAVLEHPEWNNQETLLELYGSWKTKSDPAT